MNIFGRNPALWIAAGTGLLQVGSSFGLDGLSAVQVGAINLAVGAVGAAVMAWRVRPIAPAVWTQAVAAVAGVLAAYGWDLRPEQVGAINVAVLAVLGLIVRGQVSPVGSPVAVDPPAAPPVVVVDQAPAATWSTPSRGPRSIRRDRATY